MFAIYNSLLYTIHCVAVSNTVSTVLKKLKSCLFYFITKMLNWKHRVFCAATYYINNKHVKLLERPLSRLELSLNNTTTTFSLSSLVFFINYIKETKTNALVLTSEPTSFRGISPKCTILYHKTDIPLFFQYWWKCVFMLYW